MTGNMQKLVGDIRDTGVIDLLDDGDPKNHDGKWQELWFFKDGTTLLETDVWNTETEAKEHIRRVVSPPWGMDSVMFNNGFKCFLFHVSHAMPIPVKE